MHISIDSKIKLSEKVKNRERRFGSWTHYYPVIIESADGTRTPALFTDHQIHEAIERAAKNPEDIPRAGGLWDLLFG